MNKQTFLFGKIEKSEQAQNKLVGSEFKVRQILNPICTNEKECKHEFVSTEYSSQPYGTCEECRKIVFRDDDDNWK